MVEKQRQSRLHDIQPGSPEWRETVSFLQGLVKQKILRYSDLPEEARGKSGAHLRKENTKQTAVVVGSERIQLTNREAEVTKILLDNKGKFIHHSTIMRAIWRREDSNTQTNLSNIISQLRYKLKHTSCEIENVYRQGYKLTCPEKIELSLPS